MKKILAAAVLAGAAVTAFAEDAPSLKFSGYLDTGVVVHGNGVDPMPFGLYGNDAGKAGGRFNLDGAYGTADSGVKFEFRSESVLGAAPVLKYAYAYASLLDKVVTINGGIVKDSTFNSAGDAAYKPVDAENGVQFIVKPAPGLALGAFVNVPAWTTTGAAARVTDASSNSFQNVALDANVAYSLDKVVGLAAGVYGTPASANKYASGEAKSGLTEYYASVSLLAVPGLTAVVEVKGSAVNDYAATGSTAITETIKYNLKDAGVPAVTLGLVGYEWLYGEDKADYSGSDSVGMSYKVNGWGSYAFEGGLTAKIGGTYLAGYQAYGNDWTTTKLNIGGVSTIGKESGSKAVELAVAQVKPELSFVVSPALTISCWYAFTTSVGAKDVYFLSNAADKTTLHSVDVDFLYKF